MGFDPSTTTTAWVALSDSTAANGCMRAVPGPTRHDNIEIRRFPDEMPSAVDVALRAGEMSLHDGHILHGSRGNRSDEKRVGFVIRYLTPDARPAVGRPPVVVARGRCPDRDFCVGGAPSEGEPDEALSGLRASALLHLDARLQTLRTPVP